MKSISKCTCGGVFDEESLNFGDLPITSLLNKNDKFILHFKRCGRCSISSAVHKLDAKLLFGKDYNFFSGTSSNYIAHAKKIASQLNDVTSLKGKSVLDIACNDGTLSKELEKYGCSIVGVDPFSAALSKLGENRNISVINDFFGSDLISKFRLEKKFDVVVVTNVISHVYDFVDFMDALVKVVRPGGFIYAENMDYDSVIKNNSYEYFYHGVYNLMSPSSFNRILGNNFAIESELGYGFDPFSKAFILKKFNDSSYLKWEGRDGIILNQDSFEAWVSRLNSWVLDNLTDRNIIGYAANSKAGLMLAISKHLKSKISFILDMNILKSGQMLAGTETKIKHPNHVDFNTIEKVVLFAPHLEEEVRTFFKSKNFNGDILMFKYNT